jgi:uncharacterized membrane protein
MNEHPRWLDRPDNVRKVVYALYAVCALLFAADLFYVKEPHFAFEKGFGFYALFGFVGCVLLVLLARLLRRWVKRAEDYYARRHRHG